MKNSETRKRMKDIKVDCFCDLFLIQFSSWYNWKEKLQNIKNSDLQVKRFFCACDVLLQLGCSQGYSKIDVFDFILSQLDEKDWLKVEKVDLVQLKKDFFAEYD